MIETENFNTMQQVQFLWFLLHCNILQANLGRLQSWEAEWLMEFNPSKCEAVTFTKKTKSVKTEYTLHGVLLATVITAKYLGERQHQHLHRAARYCSTLSCWCLYELEEAIWVMTTFLHIMTTDKAILIRYKLGVTVHRCLQSRAAHWAQYLVDCWTPTSDVASRQRLRCASRYQLIVPRHHHSLFRRRAFSVVGPMTWNSLPDNLRDPTLSDD